MCSCHAARKLPVAAQAVHPSPATADLRQEHDVILRALAILERAAQRLASGQTVDGTAWWDLVSLLRTFADRCHHAKEEAHLFVALEREGMTRDTSPIGALLAEHEEGRGYVRTLATAAPPAERAAAAFAYVSLLRDHIEKENAIFFPMAEDLLSEETQAALAHAYEGIDREVVGSGGRARIVEVLEKLERVIVRGAP